MAYQDCMDESVHGSESAHININRFVESSRLMPLIVVLCVLTGASLVTAMWAVNAAESARRSAQVATMRTEGFTRAMIAQGIDPYPHIAGEDP